MRLLACNAALAQGAMSEMPTQQQVRTAHKRRALLIAQMQRQAMETANDLLTQHTIEAGIAKVVKDARRRRNEAIAGALVVVLCCILALLAMTQ